MFAADRGAVERILANLIGNAMAALGAPADQAAPLGGAAGTPLAPPRGHVWLAARALPRGPGRSDAILLEVSDDGPGFPPGTTAHVFERFYRADAARSRGGSGLGLSIVRELARAHGGDAVAENLAPRGARVSVLLPQVPRPAAV